MSVSSELLLGAAAVAAPIVLAQLGLSADAWRRARRAEETSSDVEGKIDVLLQSLGIDPDDPPEYPLRDVSHRGGSEPPRADGGDRGGEDGG